MCGIVGYIGEKKAAPILLDGLKRLEYRGYDSAGLATVYGDNIDVKKDIGKIKDVDKKHKFKEMKGNIGLGHSRWATHGGVTKANAHPHCNFEDDISIVHNGIIENHDELKEKLNIKFCSDTDTEVIVHLVDKYYKGDLKEAVLKSLKKIEGAYAIGLISAKHPDVLVAARNESPLIIGVGKKENFIASDVPAILNRTNKVIYLDNQEFAIITKDNVDVFDIEGKKIKKEVHTIKWTAEQAEKSGFEHYMLKEIFEQPNIMAECVEGLIENDSINLDIDEKNIKDIKRIIIVACKSHPSHILFRNPIIFIVY